MSQRAMLNSIEISSVYPQDVISSSVFGRGQRGRGSSPRVITSYIDFSCCRTQLSSASTGQCGSRQRRHWSMCKRSRAHDKGEFALSPVNGSEQNVQTRGIRRHTRNRNIKALFCLPGQLQSLHLGQTPRRDSTLWVE